MYNERPTGPMSEDELGTALEADLEDACTYADAELGPLRAQATHYYHARAFGDEEDGRSQVVMPVVRDTIRATLPSLMRKFFGSKRAVEFESGTRTSGDFASDATAAVQYVFGTQNPGMMIAWSAMKDALRSKMGWLKWWWDESIVVTAQKYSGVTEQQLLLAHSTLKHGESLDVLSKMQVGVEQQTKLVPDPRLQGAPNVQNQQEPPAEGAEEGAEAPPQGAGAPPNLISGAPGAPSGAAAPPGAPTGAAGVPPGLIPVQVPVPVYEYTIRITRKAPKKQVRISAVPPDEIVFVRDARDLDNCRMIAHRTRKTRGELIAMGVSPDDLESLPSDDMDQFTNLEFLARQPIPNTVMPMGSAATWDQEYVPYYECYYRVDADGDGISELRKVCRLGRSGKIVSNEIWSEVPLSQLCPDPEPHVMVGLSQADYVMDLQSINSHIWRDLLDSLKQSIFPRMAYVEGQANLDDVLNSEIGAAIRMRQPGMVQPLVVPFTGQQAMPLIEELDKVRESRTGIGSAALALDGKALQSTTPVAAEATVGAAEAQIGMTALMFANGFARMFKGILRLLCENQDSEMTFQLNGRQFVVNPAGWDPDLNAVPDTGLGDGSNTDQKLSVLSNVANAQTAMLQQLGFDNPLCGLQEYYNVVTEMLELAGFRDTTKFWRNPTEAQQRGKQIQNRPSPEQITAQANVQVEGMRAGVQRLKTILDDHRKLDQLLIENHVKLAEINAKYGTHIDAKLLDAVVAREQMNVDLHMQQQDIQSQPPPAQGQ